MSLRVNFYTNVTANNVVTSYGFDAMLKDFIKLYCTSADPKGDVIEYLKSEKCQKPHDKSVTEHQDRMEEIMRYSKQLEGA